MNSVKNINTGIPSNKRILQDQTHNQKAVRTSQQQNYEIN